MINSFDREVYYDKLSYIILSGEGFKFQICVDTKGVLTMGYGSDINRGSTPKSEWDSIFKGRASFKNAKNSEIEITRIEAKALKNWSLVKRKRTCKNIRSISE